MGVIRSATGPLLVLVRHGQCRSNIRFELSTYRESNDVLTLLGRRQSLAAAKMLVKLLPSRNANSLVCSTLIRAVQTADIIAPRIRRLSGTETDVRLEEKSDKETWAMFRRRVRAAIVSARRLPHHVICVTHGHVIQAVLADALGIPMSNARNLCPANCGLTILQNDKLVAYNLHEHLLRL